MLSLLFNFSSISNPKEETPNSIDGTLVLAFDNQI